MVALFPREIQICVGPPSSRTSAPLTGLWRQCHHLVWAKLIFVQIRKLCKWTNSSWTWSCFLAKIEEISDISPWTFQTGQLWTMPLKLWGEKCPTVAPSVWFLYFSSLVGFGTTCAMVKTWINSFPTKVMVILPSIRLYISNIYLVMVLQSLMSFSHWLVNS